MFLRNVTPGSTSRLTTVDHNETYGRHILENAMRGKNIRRCLDIGCGLGTDLSIVSRACPNTELFGIDFGDWNSARLAGRGITLLSKNIERDRLPFDDNSLDLVIANQVFEHTKEVFWINHEIFRCLSVGGFLFLGVPNILSFHNRILMLGGYHPTQHKLTSAHVRPFSKKDVFSFYRDIAGNFCRIDGFWGSQFYPFPKSLARLFSRMFPASSFSIFFLIRKTAQYDSAFLKWPEKAQLETNFYTG